MNRFRLHSLQISADARSPFETKHHRLLREQGQAISPPLASIKTAETSSFSKQGAPGAFDLGENEREAGLSPAEHHFGGSDTGLLTPANRVADLSFGTMNLRTIVKNTAFVEDQSQRES